MKLFHTLALSALLLMPMTAAQALTVSVKACAQAKANNRAEIRQDADINFAGCIQAGRNNALTIEQFGVRNVARSSQHQRRW